MQFCSFVLVIFAVLVTFTAVVGAKEIQRCNHEEIKAKLEVQDIQNEPNATPEMLSVDSEKKRRLQGASTTFQPIRIAFDTTGLKGLDAAKYDIIVNQVLPAAQQIFQSFVSVLPLKTNLTIAGSKCYQANIDPKYNTQGIANTDLVIFATYDTTTTNLLAWATACVLSSKNGQRPTAGQINFAALNLQTGLYEFQEVLKTVIHEMIHVLVFSPSLFNYYKNPDGTSKSGALKNATVRGVSTTLVTLPTIVAWVRKHLNCSSVAGAELENQGTSASKGAHWERRVFGNEMMTSSLSHDAVLTNLTMNLFEESGWYIVDRSKAADLQFGKNQGCNFVDGACIVNNKSQFPGQFCDTVNVETCSPSYRSKAACPIGKFGMDIPSTMNYFGDGQTGTNDMFADNCPSIMNTNGGDCTDPSNFKVSNSKFFEEVYGGASRCFSGNFIKEGAARSGYNTFNHGTCLKSKCQSGTLTVFLGDQVIVCPVAGGPVTVPGYRGTFNCPAAADFCYNAFDQMCGVNSCGGVGLCVAGKCYCPPNVEKSLCDPTWTAATDVPAAAITETQATTTTESASTTTTPSTSTSTPTSTSTTNPTTTTPTTTTTTTTTSNVPSNTNSNNGGSNSTASSLINSTSNATITFAPLEKTAKSGSILGSILCSSLFVIFMTQFLL